MLICAVFMLACTTTTIHVNKRYLNDDEASKVKKVLVAQGFNVKFNELNYPNNINSTSIIYSPFIADKKAIAVLEASVQSIGYDIDSINALVSANHWYTKNTIGLFIVPHGVFPNSGKSIEDIALLYKSEQCETDTALNLYKNGLFTYTRIGQVKISGSWSITQYPYILLANDAPYINFYYEIVKIKRVDRIGEIEITQLHPLSSTPMISSCDMTYGLRT